MSETYVRKYGLDFPPGTHPIFIDLLFAKNWRFAPYNQATPLHPPEHMLRAMRALFTRDELSISRWTEQHVEDFVMEQFCITLGCASCSKSNDYGCLVLLDWICSPNDTLTILASTTVDMLKIRSYEAVIRYFKILKRNAQFSIPGKESKTTTAILLDDDDDELATVKASIRGVAVSAGSIDEAKGKLQGGHMKYVRYVGDELSNMRQAFMEARVNASIGATDFRLFGLANPLSITDLACQYCEPAAPGGWATVNKDSVEWRSRYGKVRHHNGTQSPAVLEPDGVMKYPYLINQEQIDRVVREHHGEDAPQTWTMVYGFPPEQGIEATVLSEKEIIAFSAQEPVVWANEEDMIRIGALDPAFVEGGDACTVETASVGRSKTGQAVIAFDPPHYIPISASSAKPAVYQIAEAVRDVLCERNVPLFNFAVDCSGTQSVDAVIERDMGPGLLRVNFANSASDKKLSTLSPEGADKRVRNVVTEAWLLFAEFVRHNQLRGMPLEVVKQFSQRRFHKAEGTKLRALETKRTFKKRTGQGSPDAADAAAMCALVARDRLGFVPGGAPAAVSGSVSPLAGPLPFLTTRKFRSNYVAQPAWNRLRSYLTRV